MTKLQKTLSVMGVLVSLGSFLSTPVLAEEARTETPGTRSALFKRVLESTKLRSKAAMGSGIVQSKGENSLVVAKDDKTYTILVNEKTKYRRHFWGKGSFEEIKVNDLVNVIGRYTDDSRTTIQAVLIRNLSVQKRSGVFFGTVKSKTATGLVITTMKRDDQTVTVADSAKIVDRREQSISLNDIKEGDRVRVKGVWDKANSTITEVTHIKDFSIPVQATSTPSAE